MDDLTNKLNAFLSSEDGMQKLQQLASALSSSGNQPGEGTRSDSGNSISAQNGQENHAPDLSGLISMLSSSGIGTAGANQNSSGDSSNPLAGLDIGMIMKIQQALSAYNQDDKNTVLLKSLKPHLRPERQNRVDEALKLMKLVSLLPLFVQSGLFGTGGER